MWNEWIVQVIDGEKTIFEQIVGDQEQANALFLIKQTEILFSLGLTESVQSNPLSGEARGLCAKMPNGQLVYMIENIDPLRELESQAGLTEALETDLERFTRPSDLPDDFIWNRKPYDPDEIFDPFSYDGSTSPEDFVQIQEKYLNEKEGKKHEKY